VNSSLGHSTTRPLDHSTTSLSQRDRDLLAALDRGDPIDLIEYADWIRRPEIQHLLTVRDQLHADQERARERRNRDFADTETRAAVAILNDTIREADTLRKAEGTTTTDQLKALNTRRIAASSILRLRPPSAVPPTTRPTRPLLHLLALYTPRGRCSTHLPPSVRYATARHRRAARAALTASFAPTQARTRCSRRAQAGRAISPPPTVASDPK
jgi:hypothetical protein